MNAAATVSYRAATRTDIPRVTEVRLAVSENVLTRPGLVTEAHYRWFVDNACLWVAEADGVVVGFSASDPRDGSIWALFMDRRWEGRGIARRLLDNAVRGLVAAGHGQVHLSTDPGTRAARFYRAAGWTESGLTDRGEILFRYDAG